MYLYGGAPNQIYAQYRNKPKAVAWYNIARTLSGDNLRIVAGGTLFVPHLVNKGEQLDVIGLIVVIPREIHPNESKSL